MLCLLLAEVLAITNARWIPSDGAAEATAVTILIEGEKIRAIGADVQIPDVARRIDAAGLFACAAPIDAFGYWDGDHDVLYASAGVALLADHGNDVLKILDAKRSTARRGAPALRIAGAVLDGFPPSTTEASVARTAVEAQAQLEPMFAEGIDFVAIQSNLGVDAWRKAIEVSHAAKRQVWGPRPRAIALTDLLAGGQDGVLFLDSLLPAGRGWDGLQLADFDASIAAMVQSGARLVPFLNGNARLFANWTAESKELELLSPQFATYWRNELAARASMLAEPAAREAFVQKGERALALQGQLVARLSAAGAILLPGSGAPHPWLMPGDGLHAELELWKHAGLSSAEVLRRVTLGAAEELGVADDRGSLAPGKSADLVLLREDPRVDVGALRRPEWVVIGGALNSRAELDQAVAALRERQIRAQADAQRPIDVGDPPKVEGELVLAGYCETSALGVRSAAERYRVVRSADGKLSFCGMRVVPQADGTRVQIQTLMRLNGKALEYFQIELSTAKHTLSVEGHRVVQQMRVQRRVDGVHVDLQTTAEAVANVDVGSVTSLLLAAATQDGGPFPVITFHAGLEMEVVRWDLALDGSGAHLFRTPEGPKLARFDARGALTEVVEQRGSGGVETRGTNTLAKDRAGLPFSEAKRARIERARREAEAQRPPPAQPPSGGR